MTLIMKATEYGAQSAGFKKSYPSIGHMLAAGWIMQPKYDGCFGMAVIRADGESRMLSRTGEDYSASCGHILDALEKAAIERHGHRWEEFVVLGEVWNKDWDFPQISGSMRRRAPCPALQFVMHDILPLTLETAQPYRDRLNLLYLLAPYPVGPLMRATQNHFVDRADPHEDLTRYAQNWAAHLKSTGRFDGAILKDPEAGYSIGNVRLGQIVKIKPTISLDLVVTGWERKTGEKTGRDVYTINVHYRGAETTVGSGIPHDYLPVIGQIVEIECMGITADGALREPRFKGVRHDKETADQ